MGTLMKSLFSNSEFVITRFSDSPAERPSTDFAGRYSCKTLLPAKQHLLCVLGENLGENHCELYGCAGGTSGYAGGTSGCAGGTRG